MMQAGNLFMFVMHNPVRWTDPWGLFAWNENDLALIDISRQNTEYHGGIFTAGNGYVTINIWDVEVTFRNTDRWVITAGNRPIKVRADIFYQAFINAAGGEMVFLGGHGAFFGIFTAPHLHIAMFAAPGTDGYNSLLEAGSNLTRWGLRHGYISGTMGGFARTRGQINGSAYMTRANRQFFNHLSSNVGTITALFDGYVHFRDNHNSTFAYSGRWTNSTSYTIGLVNAMGLNHGLSATQVRQAWGINNAFAARYFGR